MSRTEKTGNREPVDLEDAISRLPLDEQEEIERLTQQYIAEKLMLRDLRKKLGITQEQMAEALEIGQDSISRLENRPDALVSTLSHYINALGGRLDLVARFPNRRAVNLSGLTEVEPKTKKRAKAG